MEHYTKGAGGEPGANELFCIWKQHGFLFTLVKNPMPDNCIIDDADNFGQSFNNNDDDENNRNF